MKQVKLAALAATVMVMTVATTQAEAQEIYAHGGTLGAGVGAALPLNSWAGVHAEFEGFGLSRSFNVDGNQYDGHLKLLQGGLYVDLFPFKSSGFRVTAGALINDDDVTAHAVPNAQGNYKIGDAFVPAVGAAPSTTITLPRVMPYLGIGYGHKPVSKGFGVTLDLGVAYGRPRTSYSVPAIYSTLATQSDIDQEEQNISNKVERYKVYPVVQIGVSYRFN